MSKPLEKPTTTSDNLIQCYYCKEFGHKRPDCPQLVKDVNNLEPESDTSSPEEIDSADEEQGNA
jgi:hypothetical protein